MTLPAGTRLGPYEIVALIGAGGMGEVYKGRDTRLDRTVAIKVLPADVAADPERRRRFEQEARAVSAVNHPHICTLYDVGSTPSTGSGQSSRSHPQAVVASTVRRSTSSLRRQVHLRRHRLDNPCQRLVRGAGLPPSREASADSP